MERYLRSVFNISFIIPLLLAWGLLIKNNYFNDINFVSTVFTSVPSTKAEAPEFEMPIDEVLSRNSFKIEKVKPAITKPEITKTEIVNAEINKVEPPASEETVKEDRFTQQFVNTQNQIKRIMKFENGEVELPKTLPAKVGVANEVSAMATETNPVVSGESAPDYDETLIELSEHASNQKPLQSKYVNTVFNRNIMRSLKAEGRKAIAVKGEALLANGPKGIVISKNNLKFLESSFARFKTRYGLAKVIVSTPEEYNENYARKINRFAKSYFNYELEFETEYEGADGLEIILVGSHL
jgi:hypothetical protein